MTSPQLRLFPARGDDRRTMLRTLERVASRGLQLGEVVGTVVCQCVPLEPGPQVFDGVQIGRVGRQESDLDLALGIVEIVADQFRPVGPEPIPDNQQSPLQMAPEGLQELDDLLLPDAAFVEAKQTIRAREPGDHRQVRPVEVKLDDGCLSPGCPCSHPRRPFADARFVDEDDQSAFAAGFFLSAGKVLRLNCSTASSLRSMARRSGF